MSVMRAMVLDRPQHAARSARAAAAAAGGAAKFCIEIDACGVCRTDLHVVDGELPHPKLADRAGT